MNIFTKTLQGILAAIFLMVGSMKPNMPTDKEQAGYVEDFTQGQLIRLMSLRFWGQSV